MDLEILWTPQAIKGFKRIINYLETHFSVKEKKRFLNDAFRFFEMIKVHPELLPKSSIKKNLYRGPINKYSVVVYRYQPRKKQIQLLSIRAARELDR
ncbi:MAG: toxin-antitoxin system COG3668 family toxin component [Algoriphagus marincola HL-49]|uniref:Toxin-antitoxin system COG3668 family toxin component n=1 Tax=Algoriphagus marincola HL-49 TaxID=1305737 RepID=A0A0P7YN04_9BACT|nr:MAG: toxin-antitoxin system COG3668 family toxin component [Algoriphagus marincola HL-49]